MPSFDKIQVGEKLPTYTITIDWNMYRQYNKMINEINPLHFDEKYAQKIGFKTIVVAGVFTYSFFLRPLLNWTKDPNSIKKIKIRYHKPVYINETITQGGSIIKKYRKDGLNYVECELWAENSTKERITTGSAILILKNM